MTLVLHPPEGGFGEETTKLAEWLSSQAAIALENARLHDVVQWQAITDELTGLVNRRRFLDALRSEITKGQRLGATAVGRARGSRRLQADQRRIRAPRRR